jgi:hypothetical protein
VVLSDPLNRSVTRTRLNGWLTPGVVFRYCLEVEGVTKALEGLLYKVEGSQPPLIKRKLIANKMEAFCHPFLTQVKSSYPIVTI